MAAIIVIIIGLAGVIGYFLFARKKAPITIEQRVMKIKNHRTMSSGMTLWVEQGANITQLEIDAIEAGLNECFGRARNAGYNTPLSVDAYTVAILGGSEKSHEQQVWCYKIPTPPEYQGSPYDLDGYLWIAGQYIDRPGCNLIVLPDHHGEDLEELARVTGYEAEHCILNHCDYEKYLATRVHSAATPHPLF